MKSGDSIALVLVYGRIISWSQLQPSFIAVFHELITVEQLFLNTTQVARKFDMNSNVQALKEKSKVSKVKAMAILYVSATDLRWPTEGNDKAIL